MIMKKIIKEKDISLAKKTSAIIKEIFNSNQNAKRCYRDDLKKKLCENFDIKFKDSQNIANVFFMKLSETITEEEILKIPNLGTFEVKQINVKFGQNFKDNTRVVLVNKKTVVLKTNTDLKKQINIK